MATEGVPESESIRHWMQERFDRVDDQVDSMSRSLSKDIMDTRHGLKGSMEQMTKQIVVMQEQVLALIREQGAIQEWRREDGPLDTRLRRMTDKQEKDKAALLKEIGEEKAWRNTMKGGLIAASLFVPIVTGVVVFAIVQGFAS